MAVDPATDQYLSDVVELAYVQACTTHAVANVPYACTLFLHCRYESDETPMVEYLNIHHTLNNCRMAARAGDFSKEPRAMVSI